MMRWLKSLFGGLSAVTPVAKRDDTPDDGSVRSDHPDRQAGDANRDLRAWMAAARHYRLYLNDHPRDFAIWVQLGHALKEDHRLSDADAAYAGALALRPRDADLLLNYGRLKRMRGELTAAAAMLGASAEIDPAPDTLRDLAVPELEPYLTPAQRRLANGSRAL